MDKIAIIGEGNFGQLLGKLLQPQYQVEFLDTRKDSTKAMSSCIVAADVIVFAVPFDAYEKAI